MDNIVKRRMLRLLAGGALIACAGMAQAQYMWLDEKGMKQVSDRPPPSSIPAKNILKSPAGSRNAESAAPASAASASASEKGPASLADREADYKKRSKEKTENDQKTAEAAKASASKQRHCDALRSDKALLDSGARMRERSGDGMMDDAGRAKAQAEANATIRQECS